MNIRVFNTLTRRKESLEPLEPGRVGMYVCGPTVYDEPHLGHARSAVVFDVINRYLRVAGLTVMYVRNITDIDDKLVEKARRSGKDFQLLGRDYTKAYRDAMRRLNVLAPDREPRVTDYIDRIRMCIAGLLEGGHAYRVGSNVYFAVASCRQYGRLSGRFPAGVTMSAGKLSDPHKRAPADFALWKAARPEEPAWPSPWGLGRPGWHIECTAMSAGLLGEQFDIHGGGVDLIFPHHENEIAQSESLFGQVPARYWLHHGLVQIRGEKMAKSMGNGLRLNDALDQYTPGALRLFLLSRRYRHPVDYSRRDLRVACKLDRRLQQFLLTAEPAVGRTRKAAWVQSPCWLKFCDALNDDFNFPRALAVVFESIRAFNREVGCGPGKRVFGSAAEMTQTAGALLFICRKILGFESTRPVIV